ncbi:serine/threonine-protein phosphatase 7 long form homolog [Amaranthus tricolor]|uniref:serine/threonine-protein phosphatase 7 long form homolog n=1 Tax=Amaranthus tricolor TaxID=29722 RepID=UPI002585B71E|nr:serine/threonine-protein phosphatase 7 long form homolog [Amaranthus tricolor]
MATRDCEATVTLLDVAVLTRLPIEGHAVCIDARQFESWQDKVHRVLGVRPPAEVTKGSSLRVTWLAQNFSQLPEGADDATVERYARAYLLYLIGAVLFSDKTGNRVQLLYLTLLDAPWEVISGYSWGSAALAYLYRRLCEASQKNVKEIAGPLIILQLWAWEHVLIGQPMRSVGRGAFAPPLLPPPHVPYGSRWSFERRSRTHTGSGVGFYRDQLDLLRADQFLWDPYPAEAYAALPQHSGILSGAWRASVPLICFDMVEGIPPPCDTEAELHHSRKGRDPKNWLEVNWRHVARWEHRLDLLAQVSHVYYE